MEEKLLQVKGLKTSFYTESGVVRAIDGVSFDVFKGETLGIVGESGCGKSVTSMSVLRLIPQPPGKIEAGEIIFEGEDLIKASDDRMREIRGNKISMIFQEPMTSLNPVFTIGFQISEVLQLHRGMDKRACRVEAIALLKKVGIPRAEGVVDDYPFSLSGGMRQRAMIAMALACQPALLIADEPSTALDVTIQAQILQIMRDLQRDTGMSIMFITHDLGVIAEMSDRVIVMYAGHIVEQADVRSLFRDPLHPYTKGLLISKPDLNTGDARLHVIPGNVPNLLKRPTGCQFHPRCEFAFDRCRQELPPLFHTADGRLVRCWLNANEKTEVPQ
jgi:oligopeptide/dipeptide ABC transporter ATP-binding protein